MDIALIVREHLDENEKNSFIHYGAELDLKYGKVFSIVEVEPEMLNKWGRVVPFYRNLLQEGLVLWKAA